jgi:DNA integrity scanning protein DisA with diadenylate cyclase activity
VTTEVESMNCLQIVLVWVMIIVVAVDHLEDRFEDLSPVEQAHRNYELGLIEEQELEHQLAFPPDDRNEEIREVVPQLNRVGEEISKDIAREFESLDELRRADREDLTAIHGVAESTADAVLTRDRE